MPDIAERLEKIEKLQEKIERRVERLEKHLGIYEITEVSSEGIPTGGRRYEPERPLH